MDNRKNNKETINNAFKCFRKANNEQFKMGMRDLLEAAVKYALVNHDENHQSHLKAGDSYGWILYHNGKQVGIHIISKGNEIKGDTRAEIKGISVPNYGWVGVVMAGLVPESYFAVDYEEQILALTADDIRANYHRYFKPIP